MELSEIIESWKEYILPMLNGGNAIFIACFDNQGHTLYVNDAMCFVRDNEPSECFINPTFDYILKSKQQGVFFEGVITFGKIYSPDNFSIVGRIIRKYDNILLLGELDIQELVDQNRIIRELNTDNNNLNRMLMIEKNVLRQTQQELQEYQQQLIEINATKDKFFSIIAHDLINPLGVFKSMTKMMYDDYDNFEDLERREILKNISDYASNSYNLLKNLLDWSRSQRGIIKADITIINLVDVVDTTVSDIKSHADKKNIKIHLQLKKDIVVSVDKNLLSTIVRNLVSNAIKFTNNGGNIIIRSLETYSHNILQIEDNGIGMDETTLNSLFKIDKHITTKGTDKEIGTGLGLILCKEFADKMNINLKVVSVLGKGTTFSLHLPK